MDGRTIAQLKHEFRPLSGIAHANLVSLHALVCERDQWCVSGALIEGVPFELAATRGMQVPSASTTAPQSSFRCARWRAQVRRTRTLDHDPSKPRDRQLTHREVAPAARTFPICVIADGIEAAVNVGSLFRLADAFGIERLFLTGGSPTPPNAKLKKTSRATERRVAHEARTDAVSLVAELKTTGYLVASLEVTAHAIDIRHFDRPLEKLALIVGAENSGVRQELLDASDIALRIPMFGQGSSLNLATACAIALFEVTKRWTLP